MLARACSHCMHAAAATRQVCYDGRLAQELTAAVEATLGRALDSRMARRRYNTARSVGMMAEKAAAYIIGRSWAGAFTLVLGRLTGNHWWVYAGLMTLQAVCISLLFASGGCPTWLCSRPRYHTMATVRNYIHTPIPCSVCPALH